jgi:hypothetical protein
LDTSASSEGDMQQARTRIDFDSMPDDYVQFKVSLLIPKIALKIVNEYNQEVAIFHIKGLNLGLSHSNNVTIV